MRNPKLYPHNDHFIFDMPEDQGCNHWIRIYPKLGIAKIQRLREKMDENHIWPAEDICAFRLITPPKEVLIAIEFGVQNGYVLKSVNKKSYVAIIRKNEVNTQINIYWTKSFHNNKKFTVQTIIDHPKKKRKQLNRKGITEEELKYIILNPRVHTGKGYYKK